MCPRFTVHYQICILYADATAISFAQYGQGTGPIFFDELRCVGTEDNLLNCPRNEIAVHDCSHFEDASVECRVECMSEQYRIVMLYLLDFQCHTYTSYFQCYVEMEM